MQKKTILSGIRATGKLHLGNYLGAIKQFIDLQNSGQYACHFFIADLHALTTPFEPKELRQNTLEVAAEFLASGLDPEKSIMFVQNQIHEHSELAWIFECITPLGELERMTQFKDKSQTSASNINAGLLNYPALMAADILMYKPFAVPVGDDQTQHLELSRIIARKFNKQFGQTFPEPKNHTLKPLRIQSLKNPEKKMSKTGDDPLYISDEPEVIAKKIQKAVTETDGSGQSLGAENLFSLLSYFGTEEHIGYFAEAKKSGSLKYSELKKVLAEDISTHFVKFREKKKSLMANPKQILEVLEKGAEKARLTASQTLREVKEKIGLL